MTILTFWDIDTGGEPGFKPVLSELCWNVTEWCSEVVKNGNINDEQERSATTRADVNRAHSRYIQQF